MPAGYKERYYGNPPKSYTAWSNIYHANMGKAIRAREIELEYMAQIGWGRAQVTVETPFGNRRLDIGEIGSGSNTSRGVEVKSYETGRVYGTQDILSEVERDSYLVNVLGWEIDWAFLDCTPSGPLEKALKEANINIIID